MKIKITQIFKMVMFFIAMNIITRIASVFTFFMTEGKSIIIRVLFISLFVVVSTVPLILLGYYKLPDNNILLICAPIVLAINLICIFVCDIAGLSDIMGVISISSSTLFTILQVIITVILKIMMVFLGKYIHFKR